MTKTSLYSSPGLLPVLLSLSLTTLCASCLGMRSVATQPKLKHLSSNGTVLAVSDTTVGGDSVVIVEHPPPGVRIEFAVIQVKPRRYDRSRSTVELKENFPTAQEPHEYLGRLEVKIESGYKFSPPSSAEIKVEQENIVLAQREAAMRGAAQRGGNAVLLMSENMVEGKYWYRNGRPCRGRSRCVQQTFKYHVFKLSSAPAPAIDTSAVLRKKIGHGYRQAATGNVSESEIQIPVKRHHCYRLAMYIDEEQQLNTAIRMSMKGLTTSSASPYYLGRQQHKFEIDSAFQPVQVVNLGCAAQNDVQERALSFQNKAAQIEKLRWKLYEKALGTSKGNLALCDQCTTASEKCGRIAQDACRPLQQCLRARDLKVKQCKGAFWFRKH